MVRVILNGSSGKMGRAITAAACNFPEIQIVAGIDKFKIDAPFPIFDSIAECDIEADSVIDFSRPDTLAGLLKYGVEKAVPLVICTTGFSKEQIDDINEASKTVGIFRSGNMSLGVNIVNSILRQFSALLYESFDIEIIEKHHNQKVDAPSGTALLLGDTIRSVLPEETHYVNGREGDSKRTRREIGMHAIRGGSIVGEHEIIFAGQGETITIKHEALTRDIFAVGSLKAAAYMSGKANGMYDMDNLINDSRK